MDNNKKIKHVGINIKSTQNTGEECDTTELFTDGSLTPLGDGSGYCVTYGESGATGYDGSTVTLEITPKLVNMLRTGTAISNLIIEKGKKHHCHYGTPFGDFIVGITTDDIVSSVGENGGDLYLKYTIDINSSFMSQNEMYINIKEYDCNGQHDQTS